MPFITVSDYESFFTRSAAAFKAWDTRRANARKIKAKRSRAAKKAHQTRRFSRSR
jgi:hypothetical protein